MRVQIVSTLRAARRDAGITQAQLASRAGLTQSAVARLERPGANPTVATVERFLRATGRTLTVAPLAPTAGGVDETQIREQLRLSPAERLRLFADSQRNLASLTARARRVER